MAVATSMAFCLIGPPALSIPPGGNPGDVPSESRFGEGTWINVQDSPLCGLGSGRVCAEFVDKEPGSPYTGVFCCVDSLEISQGRFSSCALQFNRDPRDDEE
ncbi:MAG: hypothetical protein AAGM22_16460 [Acidobacteriota bacterium]